MLDPRLYRVAFVPVLLALLVAAFSLAPRQSPLRTTLPPDAFDGQRAMASLDALAARYPDRRPGSVADEAMALDIAARLRALVPGTVQEHRFRGRTADGERQLVDVIATRPGVAGPGIVVVAHRDALGTDARAELSGTAALLELARVAGGGRVRRTITFISTSGGSGGYAGAREEARRMTGRADAVIVLGDLASAAARRPFVVGTSDGQGQAPIRLQRTLSEAIRAETGADAGAPRALAQWARFAAPVALGEQGPFLREGQPAALVSVSGERPPHAGAAVREARLAAFGRAVLRSLYALDNGPVLAAAPSHDVVLRGKLLPAWAVRLLIGSLLLPPLLTGVDALARARRRRETVARWIPWAWAAGLPFAMACGAAVLLAASGLIAVAPGAPLPPDALELDGTTAAALAAIALIFALGWVVLRPSLLRATGLPAADPSAGAGVGAGLAVGLAVVLLWVLNPHAAALAVPAAHLWMWAAAPETGLRRRWALLLVATGLLPMVAVALGDAHVLGLSPGRAVWFWTLLVAGGHVSVLTWLAWSLVWGGAAAVAVIVARRRPGLEEPEEVTVRGPVSYAGPGSLGGTQSALRR